jgi:hypothetical protein
MLALPGYHAQSASSLQNLDSSSLEHGVASCSCPTSDHLLGGATYQTDGGFPPSSTCDSFVLGPEWDLPIDQDDDLSWVHDDAARQAYYEKIYQEVFEWQQEKEARMDQLYFLYGRFLYGQFLYRSIFIRSKFIRSDFIRSKFIQFKIYTVQNLYGSKFIQVKIYTVQNLYGSKFIRVKIYTGQNLYSSKFIRSIFIQVKFYTGTKASSFEFYALW